MSTDRAAAARHPAGEQPLVEYGKERSVIADTFAGRVHVEWEKGEGASMTPLGQLPDSPGPVTQPAQRVVMSESIFRRCINQDRRLPMPAGSSSILGTRSSA